MKAYKEHQKKADESFSRSDWRSAIEAYTRAIELNPQHPALLDKNSTKEDYEAAINAHFNRAEARLRLGDTEGAGADYAQVVFLNPHDTEAKSRLEKLSKKWWKFWK